MRDLSVNRVHAQSGRVHGTTNVFVRLSFRDSTPFGSKLFGHAPIDFHAWGGVNRGAQKKVGGVEPGRELQLRCV